MTFMLHVYGGSSPDEDHEDLNLTSTEYLSTCFQLMNGLMGGESMPAPRRKHGAGGTSSGDRSNLHKD